MVQATITITTITITTITIKRAEEKLTGLYPPCRYAITPKLSLK
jgi:hypothetical protein